MLQRQWMADSEQPLEVRSLTPQELLAESHCACDVLLYPSRLSGELLQRGWIVKLPKAAYRDNNSLETENGSLQAATNETGTATDFAATQNDSVELPAAWRAQSEYAGETIAVPLGCSIPVAVVSQKANELFASQTAVPKWTTVLDTLAPESRLDASQVAPKWTVTDSSVDREALVDRFLAVVATVSERDPSYGLLFDIQTMHSRLNEPEFAYAASLLARLGSQPDGQAAVLGSHTLAWKWAAESDLPRVSLASAVEVEPGASELVQGDIWLFDEGATSSDPDLLASAATGRSKVRGWNVGAGLLAGMSANCRQSTQAVALMRWLQQARTRSALASLIPGIDPGVPPGGIDSLSSKSRQKIAENLTSNSISQELRLPKAHLYRESLAEGLLQYLRGDRSAEQAMQETDQRWWEITQQADSNPRLEYEHSLGLAL
jgi:hypothetical protein